MFQDASGDGNSSTSDGLYVYDRKNNVSIGDSILVSGTVQEYNGMTQLSNILVLQVTTDL